MQAVVTLKNQTSSSTEACSRQSNCIFYFLGKNHHIRLKQFSNLFSQVISQLLRMFSMNMMFRNVKQCISHVMFIKVKYNLYCWNIKENKYIQMLRRWLALDQQSVSEVCCVHKPAVELKCVHLTERLCEAQSSVCSVWERLHWSSHMVLVLTGMSLWQRSCFLLCVIAVLFHQPFYKQYCEQLFVAWMPNTWLR